MLSLLANFLVKLVASHHQFIDDLLLLTKHLFEGLNHLTCLLGNDEALSWLCELLISLSYLGWTFHFLSLDLFDLILVPLDACFHQVYLFVKSTHHCVFIFHHRDYLPISFGCFILGDFGILWGAKCIWASSDTRNSLLVDYIFLDDCFVFASGTLFDPLLDECLDLRLIFVL